MEIRFEWDEQKNIRNQQKHGVSFEEAQTVFYDEDALLEYDEGHSDTEDRFRILGESFSSNLLIVVHCYRAGDRIRIISSRRATRAEARQYAERK